MLTIGARLKEERLRLGLTQPVLATVAGISKTTQVNYENDRSPDAHYLAAIASVGVDVLYVLTGTPASVMNSEEAELLRLFRTASPEIRAALFGMLGASLTPPSQRAGVSFGGSNRGHVMVGDHAIDQMTINVGNTKKRRK